MSDSASDGGTPSLPVPECSLSDDGAFLLNALPDAVYLLKQDGTLLDLNAETARRLGRLRDELVGRLLFDFLPTDAAEAFRRHLAETVQTGHPVFFEERGTGRVVYSHLYPVPAVQGRPGHVAVVGRDMTAQRTAEEALHASRMLLNRTTRMGKMGAWEWDAATDSIYWSDATYRLHGMDPAKFTPGLKDHIKWSLACYDADAAPVVMSAFRCCVRDGVPYDLEVPFTNIKGDKLRVRTGAEAIRDAAGAVIRVVGYITDVSDLHSTEEALRQSELKFRSLVDEAAEMLFVHDLQGRICEVNRAAQEVTGYSRGELLDMFVWDLDPVAMDRADQSLLWIGLPVGSRSFLTTRHRRKDGTEYPAEVRVAKVELGGEPYILALATDVTRHREAEQKIKASEQRLVTLLANLPGMAYRCANAPDWSMEFVSEGALALTGYRPDELQGAGGGVDYSSLIHPGDRRRVWSAVQGAVEEDRSFTVEYRILDAAGAEKWVWEKGRCVDHLFLEGFITDITERKRYEEALAEKTALENQLHHLQKADSINRLAGSVAHHFNNKLHSVIASLELAQMPDKGSGYDQEALSIAMDAAQQATEISRLMLSCLGQTHLARSRVDLVALCRDLRPVLAEAMPETVLLDMHLPAVPLEVWADAEALRQMITHLAANAWEAEGTTRVGLKVLPVGSADVGEGVRNPIDWNPGEGTFVAIEVTDDGPGISATMVEQIFDPFFSTKFTGRGIGLALVLGLVRSHGGGVVVNSTPGRGTVFRLCLPASPPTDGVGTAVSVETTIGTPAPAVLLVEDETPVRELAAMMLQSLGCRVLEAANGREALRVLDAGKNQIHCVLADIRMPELDGWGLLRELRKIAPDLPVIFATAYNDATVPPAGRQQQPDALIRKPYLLRDIKNVLDRLLSKQAV